MTPIFFATAGVMLIVALLLVLWPLQRGAAKSMSRVREAAGKLRALDEARAAGSVGEEQSATLQAAIDELLVATVDLERRGAYFADVHFLYSVYSKQLQSLEIDQIEL